MPDLVTVNKYPSFNASEPPSPAGFDARAVVKVSLSNDVPRKTMITIRSANGRETDRCEFWFVTETVEEVIAMVNLARAEMHGSKVTVKNVVPVEALH